MRIKIFVHPVDFMLKLRNSTDTSGNVGYQRYQMRDMYFAIYNADVNTLKFKVRTASNLAQVQRMSDSYKVDSIICYILRRF